MQRTSTTAPSGESGDQLLGRRDGPFDGRKAGLCRLPGGGRSGLCRGTGGLYGPLWGLRRGLSSLLRRPGGTVRRLHRMTGVFDSCPGRLDGLFPFGSSPFRRPLGRPLRSSAGGTGASPALGWRGGRRNVRNRRARGFPKGSALKLSFLTASMNHRIVLRLGSPQLYPPHCLLAALFPDELTPALGVCLGWRFCRGDSLMLEPDFLRFDSRSLLADRGSLGRLFRRRKRLRLPWL